MFKINAVADKEFSIEAAIAKLPLDVQRLSSSAGIAVAGTLTVAQVDAKLAASQLSTLQKLQLKVGLNRAGLLAD
jgi:hypothetical protein